MARISDEWEQCGYLTKRHGPAVADFFAANFHTVS